MKKTYALEGQSFFFNSLFIVLNLIAVTLITIGFHESFEDHKWLYAGSGFALLVLSAAGVIVFKGKLFMAFVSRILVGGLFIVSGLIKANDPSGFAYKLEEYFEDGALAFRIKEAFGMPDFSLEFLIPWALTFSIIICVFEIVLGVLVLIGGKIKLVSWLLLLMMLFFTFLTWHTANCDGNSKFLDRDTYVLNSEIAQLKLEESKTNKEIKIISKNDGKLVVDEMKQPQCVLDCGCFGDAMKGSVGRSLTPKETLWKDFVLLYLVVWIFVTQWRIRPNTGRENSIVVPISLLVISFFSFVFGWFFPIIFGLIAILAALWILQAGGKMLGNHWGSALVVTLLSSLMIWYVMMYSPLKDYRPYAVGSNLKENMLDGVMGEFQSGFILKNMKTGADEFFTEKEYMDQDRKLWEDPNYKYVDMQSKELKKGKLPSIDSSSFNPTVSTYDISAPELKMKYVEEFLASKRIAGVLLYDKNYKTNIEVSKEEYNVTDYDTATYRFEKNIEMIDPNLSEISIRDFLLEQPTVFILFSRDLNNGNFDNIDVIKSNYAEAKKRGIPFVMVCAGSRADIDAWRNKYNLQIPAFTIDFIEMKVVTRSNPALMILQNGIVKGKYPHRLLPKFSWIEKHVLNK
ncbi:MAG: DoxX family protein [Crocinitomicaceae bacterium]|nr:DoxX family protein [Crocinitomicaceae bacterium]